jgi:hypothetical protein
LIIDITKNEGLVGALAFAATTTTGKLLGVSMVLNKREKGKERERRKKR